MDAKTQWTLTDVLEVGALQNAARFKAEADAAGRRADAMIGEVMARLSAVHGIPDGAQITPEFADGKCVLKLMPTPAAEPPKT